MDDYVVHDLNRDPVLPFNDESFDAAVITVSIQYITQPVEVFREVNRTLKPGGPFLVIFSNRMFVQKAVRIWTMSTDGQRAGLVRAYFNLAGNFEEMRRGSPTLRAAHQETPSTWSWARRPGHKGVSEFLLIGNLGNTPSPSGRGLG